MASSLGDFRQSSHAERRDIGGRVGAGGGGAFEIKLFQKSPRKICILLCFQSFLCAKHVFYLNESYFYSRSFQKYSRTSVENSRTFQGYPTISQFLRTLQGLCEPCLYPRHNLTPASNFCEAAPRFLFWPEADSKNYHICFEFPFNLTGQLNNGFLTGQPWGILKFYYTAKDLAQGFGCWLKEGLKQRISSVHGTGYPKRY